MKGCASLERIASDKGVPRSGDPGLGASLFDKQARGPRRLDGSGHYTYCLKAGEAGFSVRAAGRSTCCLSMGGAGLQRGQAARRGELEDHHTRIMLSPLRLPKI